MWPVAALIAPFTCHSKRRQPIGGFCPFDSRLSRSPASRASSNMSATSVFPMCVRASRGLLRLRSGAAAASSPAAAHLARTLSSDKPPSGAGGAAGGLAQAILQERLQQQSQGQPPPEGAETEKEGEKAEDKKQKENTAYAKKMVLRLAGLMGLGGAVGIVYIFGVNLDRRGVSLQTVMQMTEVWERKGAHLSHLQRAPSPPLSRCNRKSEVAERHTRQVPVRSSSSEL
nr:PREDICTED: mitochondrial import inner membrane translocase subunit TIM50-like [Paralichthys olivaceus]